MTLLPKQLQPPCNFSAWVVLLGQQCHLHHRSLYRLLLHNSDYSQALRLTRIRVASFPGLPRLRFLIACWLSFAYCKRSKTRAGEGLGTRLRTRVGTCMYGTILRVWFPRCPLFRGNFVLKSAVGSLDLVRCPESRSVRFSEVV